MTGYSVIKKADSNRYDMNLKIFGKKVKIQNQTNVHYHSCREVLKSEVLTRLRIRPQGYNTFSMLNLAEHKIYLAHKCENANNCWHFNIYKLDKYNS